MIGRLTAWLLAAMLLAALAVAQTPAGVTIAPVLVPPATTALNFGVGQGTISVKVGGSSYAAGDTVTLSCPGATFTTAPVIGITHVTGGVADGVTLALSGVATASPASSVCTQASTTGTGIGLTVNVTFGVIASNLSAASLGTGGSAANGNFFLGAEQPAATFAGSETTFVGDKAGSGFTGAAIANTAFGHNACGNGAGVTATGADNTCVGDDAGRNIAGTAGGTTAVGQNALRTVSGNYNTAVGMNAGGAVIGGTQITTIGAFSGQNISDGNSNTILGENAGNSLTHGQSNVIIGQGVSPTTLTTGSYNIVMGIANNCDAPSAAVQGSITICSLGGAVWSLTGGGTPATSATVIAGSEQATAFIVGGGTKFTVTGCSASTTVGGPTAGQFASGSTSTCTFVITMNGATGLTAPNGWGCWGSDVTSGHEATAKQTGTSTTTCSLIVATTSGDTVVFGAMAY